MKSTHKPFYRPLKPLAPKEDMDAIIGRIWHFMLDNCVGNINACTSTGISRRTAIPDHLVTKAIKSLSRRQDIQKTACRIEGRFGFYIPELVALKKEEDEEYYEETFFERVELSKRIGKLHRKEKLLEAIDIFLDYGKDYPEDWGWFSEEVDLLIEALNSMEKENE